MLMNRSILREHEGLCITRKPSLHTSARLECDEMRLRIAPLGEKSFTKRIYESLTQKGEEERSTPYD